MFSQGCVGDKELKGCVRLCVIASMRNDEMMEMKLVI